MGGDFPNIRPRYMALLHYSWFANGLAPIANVVMVLMRIVEINETCVDVLLIYQVEEESR